MSEHVVITPLSLLRRAAFALGLLLALCTAHAENPPNWWIDIANDRSQNVAAMLAQGADPNELSSDGQPAIMQAIRDGAWKVYDVLLVHPATVYNGINVNRETPLMYLAVIGETERARDLIRRGAMVNRKGWTPLHYAASTAKMDTARMLLEHGADVNALAPDGTTPLMMAAYAGSEPMVRLLLEQGADAGLKTRQDYDAADWAGFKSHTVLAAKLRDLIDHPAGTGQTARQQHAAPAAEAASDAETGRSSSTSRYFDLERFDRPATP